MSDKIYKDIENSEEFKATMEEDTQVVDVTQQYKNKVASRISNVSKIILIAGIVVAIFLFCVSVIKTDDLSSLPSVIIIAVSSLISSLLFSGLAEIIELLQGIKDK